MANAQGLWADSGLHRRLASFAIVGLIGYVVDAGSTIAFAKILGAPPLLARPPAVMLAMLVTFTLNRAFTFDAREVEAAATLARYVLVAIASAAINYAAYALCLAAARWFGVLPTPALLAAAVACGSGVAMLASYPGFRFFAFRHSPIR